MLFLKNPLRGVGITPSADMSDKQVSTNAEKVLSIFRHCPMSQPTPLLILPELAAKLGIAELYLKDERERMGLGSFKATGAAYVIALAASEKIESLPGISLETVKPEQLKQILNGGTYVCASAGNHGLSVAAGARVFGATAVIYLSQTVPESFAERLREFGAEVVRAGNNYEESMTAAAQQADQMGWTLLSDSSWPGYTEIPTQVMEGYLLVAAEVVIQFDDDPAPSHIFLQAGVGGIAAAATAYFRSKWGDEPVIVVVEPEAAPALIDSIRAQKPVISEGPVSNMGRLDCKEPSHIALGCLSREADFFVTISDEEAQESTQWLTSQGIHATPSATAGLAVVYHSKSDAAWCGSLGLNNASRVLALITEQA